MKISPTPYAAAAAALLVAGCGTVSLGVPTATATLAPTRGNTTAGNADFAQHGDKVMVRARVTGLKPDREHGFHVHEKGDCSAPDATSAGGHYNPTTKPHGPQHAAHHAGDMPSLKANAAGVAEASFTLDGVGLGQGSVPSLVGRGLIVHADPDDYMTQPTGNAGARLACAVIQAK